MREQKIAICDLPSSILDLFNLRESNRGRSEAHLLNVKVLQELAVLELVEKARLSDIGGFELAGALVRLRR